MAISIAPRPPIQQGIDVNNSAVLNHNAIYDSLIRQITSAAPTFTLNPYGTAPLSGVLGIVLATTAPIQVKVTAGPAYVPVEYNITPAGAGANLLPILGFVPGAVNSLVVTSGGTELYSNASVVTSSLPPTDAELEPIYPFTGFAKYEVTIPAVNPPEVVSELYFTCHYNRYNVGADHTGTIRWYTSLDIPSYNLFRLFNGNFVGATNKFNDSKDIYEFDMVGRVHTVYRQDNEAHHAIQQMPNGNLIVDSENTDPESPDYSLQDAISIVDLATGAEVAYYDAKLIMDPSRPPRPTERPGDWLHINDCYYNAANNLLVASARHQGVFGFDKDTGELAFALSNHVGWSAGFEKYLLTPVDADGKPLYDFTKPADVDLADKEFWNWGQHSVIDAAPGEPGILDILILDNGNYRSREDRLSVPVNENYSEVVRYVINLRDMTVKRVFDYGKTEVGNRAYSSFVCTINFASNGNYIVNFGGAQIDENGRQRTLAPGESDLVDPLEGEECMSRLFIQEVNPETKTAVFEMMVTSNRPKTLAVDGPSYRYDMSCFRTYKLPILG